MVRGKEIKTMLNHNGHAINYWECEQIDTTWATNITETFQNDNGCYRAIVPRNITPGQFTQSAADNADVIQDIPSGKDSVHVMSMAFYQAGYPLCPKTLLHKPPSCKFVKKKSPSFHW